MGSAITIIICVVGVNRSINALNAPVRNSNDRNSEFSFLVSVHYWVGGWGGEVPATEFEGFNDGGDFFETLGVQDLALRGV